MKDLRGVLWRKREGASENAPLLSGYVTIEGKEYRLAIWKSKRKEKATDPDYDVVVTERRRKEGDPVEKGYADEVPF